MRARDTKRNGKKEEEEEEEEGKMSVIELQGETW